MRQQFILSDQDPRAPLPSGSPGQFILSDQDPREADQSPETAFAGLSPEERSALAVKNLGPPEPASAIETVGNAVSGAGYALGDIPAGIEQLASRYLPVPDSYKEGVEARVAEYEAKKKDALDKPGGTAGYVGGQIGTAFVPGTGPLRVAANAGRVAKVAAYTRPVAAGATLTAVKPYETEADRAQATGTSLAIGTAAPAVLGAVGGTVRAVGERIRPRPTVKPPAPGPIPGVADDAVGEAAPAGVPPGGTPPGGAPPAPPADGFSDRFIRKLKAAPGSRRKGELLESAQRLEVKLTPGRVAGGTTQTLEEQMQKLPGSRKLAEKESRESYESYHRALGRQMGLEDMPEPYLKKDVIEAGMKKLGDEYDEILPNIRMTNGSAVTSKLVSETEELVKPFDKLVASNIPESQARRLANIKQGLDDQLAEKGQISGGELKRWKTQIDKISDDPNLDAAVQQRLQNFKDALKDTFARALDETDPALAARLRLNDKRWATAEILKKVQTSAGASVEGFVSGPQLLNEVVRRYGNPSKVGDLGELADMGQMFFKKGPDSGTADRLIANTILTGNIGAAGYGLLDPSTAVGLHLIPKAAAHAYYGTRGYRNTLNAGRAAASAGTRVGASGAGRTGAPEEARPRNAMLH